MTQEKQTWEARIRQEYLEARPSALEQKVLDWLCVRVARLGNGCYGGGYHIPGDILHGLKWLRFTYAMHRWPLWKTLALLHRMEKKCLIHFNFSDDGYGPFIYVKCYGWFHWSGWEPGKHLTGLWESEHTQDWDWPVVRLIYPEWPVPKDFVETAFPSSCPHEA